MSDYFFWRYRLKLAGGGKLNAQTPEAVIEGALIRDRAGGHACLQPWPTLGQGTLDESLALLREGGDSELLASCHRCLALDGAARRAGLDLFEGKTVPPSHFSVPEWADSGWLEEKKSDGFEIFKLKCGGDIRSEARRIAEISGRLGAAVKLRLDFNECLDPCAFREFVGMLGGTIQQIDFVEDPLPYDAEIWSELATELAVDLAVDRANATAVEGFAVRVIKPAWEPVFSGSGRAVFTSAMDHPVGQLFAAYEAAIFEGGTEDCGLLTHGLFEANEFSERLGVDERRLVPPGGIGLGFGDLLDALPWEAL